MVDENLNDRNSVLFARRHNTQQIHTKLFYPKEGRIRWKDVVRTRVTNGAVVNIIREENNK